MNYHLGVATNFKKESTESVGTSLSTTKSITMTTKKKKATARVLRPFIALIRWWKRRKFYLVDHEESVPDNNEDPSTASTGQELDREAVQERSLEPSLPQTTYFRRQSSPQLGKIPMTRSLTVDSFQDSVESMDSLFESYWDPEDETSQVTTPVSNTGYQAQFLVEHLGFLCAQTQPREVEVVYKN